MSENQLDPRQLAAQMELVQRELARLDRRMEALEQALVETQQGLSTVKFLAESTGPQQVLVSLGAGVQAFATVDASSKLISPIGAGYATEAPASDVAAALEKRLQSIQTEFNRAGAEAQRLSQAAAAMNQELSSLSADMV